MVMTLSTSNSVATTPEVIPYGVETLNFSRGKDIRMFFLVGLTSKTTRSSDQVILLDTDHVNLPIHRLG